VDVNWLFTAGFDFKTGFTGLKPLRYLKSK